jgi:ubiquinone/menaquinone biosynthesis C-methylase UbiE
MATGSSATEGPHPAASASLKQRLLAAVLATVGPKTESRFKERKEKLFSQLSRQHGCSSVLEIGIGGAPNLKYYAANNVDTIIGVDPNPAMQKYALKEAASSGLSEGKLRLVVGDAQALPLEDASMDAVVSTLVLCSVPSPEKTLAEVLRVLKPGRKFFFMEHVAAEEGSTLRSAQRWAAPVVRCSAECSVDRETLKTIQEAGFKEVEADEYMLDLPVIGRIWAPSICGVAVK